MPRRKAPPKVYATAHDYYRGIQAAKYGRVSWEWWLYRASDMEKDATMLALKRVLKGERKATQDAINNPHEEDDEDDDDDEVDERGDS